ncbi:MAG: DUF1045 domain-containing protein [Pseudomonadota bacterium]
MRYAIYFTPPNSSHLTKTAARWLGRDVCNPAALFETHQHSDLTQSPRRYGFHATMKAPFRLADGMEEGFLISEFEKFCAGQSPVTISKLVLTRLGSFFALMPNQTERPLNSLAEQCVRQFEPLRAPLSDEDYKRRKPETLSLAEHENLVKWGYPYIFSEFRFHMTLTDRVPEARISDVKEDLAARFADVTNRPLEISSLSLFCEPEPGAPFEVLTSRSLSASALTRLS